MNGPKIAYQHFCPAARALEIVGEKWTLLLVRDLLAGPRRFSDLRRSLAAITPKWLSTRLRELEAAGIVEREAAGKREVWYRLTPRGEALRPVVEELIVWGYEHALRPPLPGEAIHPGRVMVSLMTYLNRRGVRLDRPVAWAVRFDSEHAYTLRFDGARWSRPRDEEHADLVLETTPEGWVTLLAASQDERRHLLQSARVTGAPDQIETFIRTLPGSDAVPVAAA